MKGWKILGRVALAAAVVGAGWGVSRWIARRNQVAANRAELVRLGLPGDGTHDFVPLPAILPHDKQAAQLGSGLFMDKRLARTSRRTCNSCHWLNAGGSDGKTHGGVLTRPIENAIATTRFLHDGSLTNFSDAVTRMLTDGTYAGGGSLSEVVSRLSSDKTLVAAFERVYKTGPNTTNVLHTIDQYARTLISAGRAFDRYQGGDANALTAQEKAGFEVFRSRKCLACHRGPVLGGHDVYEGRKVTQLRGLGRRRIYLSDGTLNDLGAVVTRMPAKEFTEEDLAAIVAFLKTL